MNDDVFLAGVDLQDWQRDLVNHLRFREAGELEVSTCQARHIRFARVNQALAAIGHWLSEAYIQVRPTLLLEYAAGGGEQ